MPLICDCRNLLDQDWEVHVLHVYCEANASADALVKRGTRQQNLMDVYSECPNFVDVSYVRDLTGLGDTRLCAPGTVVGVVWNQYYINKTSRFPPKYIYIYIYIYITNLAKHTCAMLIIVLFITWHINVNWKNRWYVPMQDRIVSERVENQTNPLKYLINKKNSNHQWVWLNSRKPLKVSFALQGSSPCSCNFVLRAALAFGLSWLVGIKNVGVSSGMPCYALVVPLNCTLVHEAIITHVSSFLSFLPKIKKNKKIILVIFRMTQTFDIFLQMALTLIQSQPL